MSLRCKLGCEGVMHGIGIRKGVRWFIKTLSLGCSSFLGLTVVLSKLGAFGKVFRGEMKKPDSKFENIAIKTIKSKFFIHSLWDI